MEAMDAMNTLTPAQEAAADYESTLKDLTQNCKLKIKVLTELADEYKTIAPTEIVRCIELQLRMVIPERKLPILYLIDSICKCTDRDAPNYTDRTYVKLFTQNIVSNFAHVFRVADEKVRSSMYKLRVSWTNFEHKGPIFPAQKLNAIDTRIREIDPAWPLPERGTGSHKDSGTNITQSRISSRNSKSSSARANNNSDHSVADHDYRLPVNNLSQNVRQTPQTTNVSPVVISVAPVPTVPSVVTVPSPLPTVIQPAVVTVPLAIPAPVVAIPNGIQVPLAPHQATVVPMPHAPTLQTPVPTQTGPVEQEDTSPVTPDVHSMRSKRKYLVELLYGGKQCTNCSMRFDENSARYAAHLDWHFRKNRKMDAPTGQPARQAYYYPLHLWCQPKGLYDDELGANENALQSSNSSNNNENNALKSGIGDKIASVVASQDDEKNVCPVCNEKFDKFWNEDQEEWQLRNAVRHEDDDAVYHPLCLTDILKNEGQNELVLSSIK